LRILLAKGGFAADRLKALSKGREGAICWTASEISAPLLLVVLRPRASTERRHKTENPNRYWQRPPHGRLPALCAATA
jgi:hypothetical protein